MNINFASRKVSPATYPKRTELSVYGDTSAQKSTITTLALFGKRISSVAQHHASFPSEVRMGECSCLRAENRVCTHKSRQASALQRLFLLNCLSSTLLSSKSALCRMDALYPSLCLWNSLFAHGFRTGLSMTLSLLSFLEWTSLRLCSFTECGIASCPVQIAKFVRPSLHQCPCHKCALGPYLSMKTLSL